jgi:YfiH family protein
VSGMLGHPLLASLGVSHSFGLRDDAPTVRPVMPKQVHGNAVAHIRNDGSISRAEADAIVSRIPNSPVGVVTADCVPLLAASTDGRVVAAIHAGWRGLAAGVIEAAIKELRRCASRSSEIRAVIGPHIGPCCYEVDAPVLCALAERYGEEIEGATAPTRPGHEMLNLRLLADVALRRAGVDEAQIGTLHDTCTMCDATRFHSFRRDGSAAGRLIHWISASATDRSEPSGERAVEAATDSA